MCNQPDYSWQDEAVNAWVANHYRGVVEAVTGTGKTRMAIKAIQRAMDEHKKRGESLYPVVVVPTGVLQRQWAEELDRQFGGTLKIGLIGQGKRDRFFPNDIVVAVVNSLVLQGAELLEFLERPLKNRTTIRKALLVADECHRYFDGPVFSRILDMPFSHYFGLTARMPQGQQQVPFRNIPHFDRIVYELDMRGARDRGLLPPFHLLNIPIQLDPQELNEFQAISDQITRLRNGIVQAVPADCLGDRGQVDIDALKEYFRHLDDNHPHRALILNFFAACFRRASIYHLARNKLQTLTKAIQILAPYGGRVLVFFERIASANNAAQEIELSRCDLDERLPEIQEAGFRWCRVIHSDMPPAERQEVVRQFGEPGDKILIACRSLDEGFDMPSVDVAILAASTQSPRQRIQRIGRALRRYDGEKRAFILTFYAEGTGDQRVPSDDKSMFPGPTDVFDCRGHDWEETFASLLKYYAER